MFKNLRSALVVAGAFALGLGLAAGPAQAAKGQWSLGGNFGVGTYSNSQFNDSLTAIGLKHVTDGFEYGGSIRYGVSEKVALDYEVNLLNGKVTDDTKTPNVDITTKAVALPLSMYYLLSQNDKYAFHLILGAGPMVSTKWKVTDGTVLGTAESASKTTFYAHGGFEGDWMVGKTVAITGRVLGRLAKASDVEDALNPNVKTDVDLSGFAFGLGLRVYFGKGY
jgi:hypothetical protein